MRDTPSMSAAEQLELVTCHRCGEQRQPDQATCPNPSCVRELERAKPASWERPENRQRGFRTRRYRRGR